MNAIELGKDALRTVWRNKYLWFFGAFVAAGAGGGGAGGGGGGAGPAEDGGGFESLPTWVWWLIIAGSLVGLIVSLLHVVSEAALIEGVRRDRTRSPQSEPTLGIRRGLRLGLSFFWRVVGIKLAFFAVTLLTAAVCLTPLLLALPKVLPLWLGIVGTVLLALPAIPFLLTVYFLYEYSLRFCVLEDLTVRAAFRRAYAYLHGRIVPSLQLLLVALLGQAAGAVASAMALVPVALIGLGLYFGGGLVLALVVAGVLAVPLLLVVSGATGAYNSAVWTLGVLD